MSNFFKLAMFSLSVLIIFNVSSGFKIDPKNPPTGQTGAPNETTCSTASGCHSGGTYSGTVALSGLPDKILPLTTYDISVNLTSTCVRTGFELTVLDKSNANCGTLTAGTNNNVKAAGTRVYVRQTNASNLSGGKASYSFKWKSPASIVGDSAFFYYVMLQANGNGSTSGDNVAKGKKGVSISAVSATDDKIDEKMVQIFPNPTADFVNLKSDFQEPLQVKMINSEGKGLMNFTLDKSKSLDVRTLTNGVYYLSFKAGNHTFTKRINIVH